MAVEITPTRHRTVVASLFVISATLGVVPAVIGVGGVVLRAGIGAVADGQGPIPGGSGDSRKLARSALFEVPLPSVTPATPPRASLKEL